MMEKYMIIRASTSTVRLSARFSSNSSASASEDSATSHIKDDPSSAWVRMAANGA
eukprot:CAMPEP_0198218898 /NCGR_PEP_ID=MMETSP1445-20131203/71707_1 /TAXON_ID=36898 /ORGANISM="Pyramimonas sp., Strain CCMP2087" /LENGTH=54 /DNA_ID=CAMNT_0043896135 /DNA_START=115 /DNA_END=276 /DNA_ORIENTATION=-